MKPPKQTAVANPTAQFSPSVSGRGVALDPNAGFKSRGDTHVPTPSPLPVSANVDVPSVPRGVMFVDSHGVIDFVEEGEPFVLRDGQILAVRDSDGSVHRMPLGRTPKFAKQIDTALAELARQ